jgi:hypothetical protein
LTRNGTDACDWILEVQPDDRLDLSRLDANLAKSGDQAFPCPAPLPCGPAPTCCSEPRSHLLGRSPGSLRSQLARNSSAIRAHRNHRRHAAVRLLALLFDLRLLIAVSSTGFIHLLDAPSPHHLFMNLCFPRVCL